MAEFLLWLPWRANPPLAAHSARHLENDTLRAAAKTMDESGDTDIVLTFDGGCCDHICDLGDVPGYAQSVEPSPGSSRGQRFIVGNGDRVKNQGQVKLRMKGKDADGLLMNSVFQIAEITRPLMSVSRICDQDLRCVFEKTHATVETLDGKTVARFERDGGLYLSLIHI